MKKIINNINHLEEGKPSFSVTITAPNPPGTDEKLSREMSDLKTAFFFRLECELEKVFLIFIFIIVYNEFLNVKRYLDFFIIKEQNKQAIIYNYTLYTLLFIRLIIFIFKKNQNIN